MKEIIIYKKPSKIILLLILIFINGVSCKVEKTIEAKNKHFESIKYSDIKEVSLSYYNNYGHPNKKDIKEFTLSKNEEKEIIDCLKQAAESSLLFVPKCINHDYIEYIIEMELFNKKRTTFEMRRCGFLEVSSEPKFLESDLCYDLFVKIYKEHVEKLE